MRRAAGFAVGWLQFQFAAAERLLIRFDWEQWFLIAVPTGAAVRFVRLILTLGFLAAIVVRIS